VKAPNELEIVVRVRPNGDFRVEASSRETFRIFHALKAVVREMERGINAKKGRLLLPNSHADKFEMNGS
jgi:hypothetical protein